MAATATPARVRLEIDAMKWAASAARIDYKLNKLDGVEATVNHATERRQQRSRRAHYRGVPEEFQERLRTIEDARR